MSIYLKTPIEVMQDLAHRVKSKRLELNLTQEGAALRSGVSLGSLKRFESTGQISLESLLKLAHTVQALSDFETVFQNKNAYQSLFHQKEKIKERQRGKLK